MATANCASVQPANNVFVFSTNTTSTQSTTCNNCRNQHVACDGQRPVCGRCVRRKFNDCEYRPPRKRGRKSGVKPASNDHAGSSVAASLQRQQQQSFPQQQPLQQQQQQQQHTPLPQLFSDFTCTSFPNTTDLESSEGSLPEISSPLPVCSSPLWSQPSTELLSDFLSDLSTSPPATSSTSSPPATSSTSSSPPNPSSPALQRYYHHSSTAMVTHSTYEFQKNRSEILKDRFPLYITPDVFISNYLSKMADPEKFKASPDYFAFLNTVYSVYGEPDMGFVKYTMPMTYSPELMSQRLSLCTEEYFLQLCRQQLSMVVGVEFYLSISSSLHIKFERLPKTLFCSQSLADYLQFDMETLEVFPFSYRLAPPTLSVLAEHMKKIVCNHTDAHVSHSLPMTLKNSSGEDVYFLCNKTTFYDVRGLPKYSILNLVPSAPINLLTGSPTPAFSFEGSTQVSCSDSNCG